MTKNYKKGETLVIEYRTPSSKRTLVTVGIVFKKSDLKLTLIHNFSVTDKLPIDVTKIFLKNILKSVEVIPREINSFSDLSTSS